MANMIKTKSNIITVPKVWGTEVWLLNTPKYCAKLLHILKGAESSIHLHPIKEESFVCVEGQVALMIDGKDYMLSEFSRPKTIFPKQKHQFIGITDALLLEVSTHHDDKDVIRFSESKPPKGEGWYNEEA